MAVYQSLAVTQISQDVTGNESQVHILWQSTQTGGSYNLTSRTAYYYVSVNGAQQVQTAVSYTLPKGSTKTVVDTVLTVPHDDQGKASVTVRTWMDTNISAGVVEQEKTLTLDTIARQSTISASAGMIGDVSKIAISRQNSAFTHRISYKFGSLTGYITGAGGISDTAVQIKNETVDFKIPEQFYSQIPDAKSGACTLTCKTYSGSTQIGTAQTAKFTVRVDETVCAPTVSGTVVDTNATTVALTGNSSTLVRFCSDALCTITAGLKNDAGSMVSKKIGGVAVTGNARTIESIETDRVVFYAKDSRGCENSVSVKCDFVKYIKLTNNASVKRTEATTGKAILNFSGGYFGGSFGAVSNSLSIQYKIGTGSFQTVSGITTGGGKYSGSVTLDDMLYTNAYKITVVVSDKVSSVSKTLTLKKGTPVFDWGEQDFAFHVPVQMDQTLALGKPLGVEYGGTGNKMSDIPQYAIIRNSGTDSGLWYTATGGGAFYATGENAPAKFGTLPIAQGGTGAATAAQALEKLGAAPAGWRQGYYQVDTFADLENTMSEVYAAMEDYTWRNIIISVSGTVYAVQLWRCKAEYGTTQLSNYSGSLTHRIRRMYAGTWQEWEWPDPPMNLGIEYCTTQRWQKKAVYTKLVDVGNLPNRGTKTVTHGAAAVQILRCHGQLSDGSAFYDVSMRTGPESIELHTNTDYSNLTATVQIWYTKE